MDNKSRNKSLFRFMTKSMYDIYKYKNYYNIYKITLPTKLSQIKPIKLLLRYKMWLQPGFLRGTR